MCNKNIDMEEKYKKNSYLVFEDELDFDALMHCSRDQRLRNVEYVEDNRESQNSVWQGETLTDHYNENYNIDVEDLEDGEVLMLKGRYIKPEREENNVSGKIMNWTKRFAVEKVGENKCRCHELTYKEAVQLSQK